VFDGRGAALVADTVMFLPLTVGVRVPPTTCVRGISDEEEEEEEDELMDAVALEAPVLARLLDTDSVGKMLAEKSERDSVGVASAPVSRRPVPVKVMTS
jgi:hypothetical protein